MRKLFITAVLVAVPTLTVADVQYYSEYKNTVGFIDTTYKDNSAVNDLRVGAKFTNWYVELGGTTNNNKVGIGGEVGYKFKLTEKWLIKGKAEGRQYDNWSGDSFNKIETEVRYIFGE
jgi:hypothetical protein|tara:strand:- start:351 stop:704 length:354 start_codon:yes stop_codon:yes gene_type:complete